MFILCYFYKKLINYYFPVRYKLVNCWYCNENSHLDFEEGEVENRWFCSHCECLNVIDENGEIVDPVVSPYLEEYPFIVSTYMPYTQEESKPKLCEDCNKSQCMINYYIKEFELMDDELEATYDEQAREYIDRKRHLETRYTLCDKCDKDVKAYLAEQDRLYGESRLSYPLYPPEKDTSKEDDMVYVREGYRTRSKAMDKLRFRLWAIMHLVTLGYFYIAYCFPDAIKSNQQLPYEIYKTLSNFASLGWHDKGDALVLAFQEIMEHNYKDMKGFIYCLHQEDSSCHVLKLAHSGQCMLLIHLFSYLGITWYHTLYYYFNETRRYHHWTAYCITQHLLFLFRTVLFVYPDLFARLSLKAEYAALIYTSIFLASYFWVKIRPGYHFPPCWPIKKPVIPAHMLPEPIVPEPPVVEAITIPGAIKGYGPMANPPLNPMQEPPKPPTDMEMLRLQMRMHFLSLEKKYWIHET